MSPELEAAFDALEVLDHRGVDVGLIGQEKREHAMAHIKARIDLHLTGQPRPEGEQQALAIIKGLALELKDASLALKTCAERMKAKGDLHGANVAYTAHKAHLTKAHEVLG